MHLEFNRETNNKTWHCLIHVIVLRTISLVYLTEQWFLHSVDKSNSQNNTLEKNTDSIRNLKFNKVLKKHGVLSTGPGVLVQILDDKTVRFHYNLYI